MTTHHTTPLAPQGQPALPAPSPLARHWQLDPGLVYLNHGSFGGCPTAVLKAQDRLRERLESDAVRYFVEEHDERMDVARRALAAFVRCPHEDLVFVPNATTAVATVLANLEPVLKPGDQVLACNHEYPACLNNLRRFCQRTGAELVEVPLPWPLSGPDEVVAAFHAALTPRTRLALISHVTSPSGLVLPVERLVPELESRGVITIIDGAHGVGFLPLNLTHLACSFYTSNCHKWLCTPKGSAFLYVRADRQRLPGGFRPLVLSNNAQNPKPGRAHMLTEFDYAGTADPTPYLAVPFALQYMAGLVEGGWDAIYRRNNQLCRTGRDAICSALNIKPPAPDSMLGALATIPLPPHPTTLAQRLASRPTRYHDALQDRLLNVHRVQVPVWSSPPGSGRRVIRISAQLYNAPEQYDYLARCLAHELEQEARL